MFVSIIWLIESSLVYVHTLVYCWLNNISGLLLSCKIRFYNTGCVLSGADGEWVTETIDPRVITSKRKQA